MVLWAIIGADRTEVSLSINFQLAILQWAILQWAIFQFLMGNFLGRSNEMA